MMYNTSSSSSSNRTPSFVLITAVTTVTAAATIWYVCQNSNSKCEQRDDGVVDDDDTDKNSKNKSGSQWDQIMNTAKSALITISKMNKNIKQETPTSSSSPPPTQKPAGKQQQQDNTSKPESAVEPITKKSRELADLDSTTKTKINSKPEMSPNNSSKAPFSKNEQEPSKFTDTSSSSSPSKTESTTTTSTATTTTSPVPKRRNIFGTRIKKQWINNQSVIPVEMKQEFHTACCNIQKLQYRLTRIQKLQFYALFKQATLGSAPTVCPPSMSNDKYMAWKGLSQKNSTNNYNGITQLQAMKTYINMANQQMATASKDTNDSTFTVSTVASSSADSSFDDWDDFSFASSASFMQPTTTTTSSSSPQQQEVPHQVIL